ncbi:MAG: Ig-like domain-containing protein [Bdellovibrionaceae bacterium]|nr:Ig-like domain-containing protein [Bdellovibrio sp.]
MSLIVEAQVFIPYSFWRGNQGPTITAIPAQKVYEGNVTTIPFTIYHKSGYPLYCSAISISTSTSNTAAVPLSAISLVGTFPFCYINITTPSGTTGSSSIGVTVRDTGNPILQATSTFTATVYNVTGLTVSPTSQIIPQNSNFRFLASAIYSDGTTQDIAPSATWSLVLLTGTAPAGLTQSFGLITVGVVTGYPTYNYTATYGAYSSTAGVSFNSSTINGLIVTPVSGNINVGGTVDVKCYATTVDGGIFDMTNNCTWTSNNDPVANVNNLFNKGRVYGNSLGGPATITATYSTFSDTAVITVDTFPPTTVDEGVGLYGRYYSTISVTGPKNDPYSALVNARIDAQVDFNWAGLNNPAGGLDDFGTRWSGQIQAPTSGLYCVQTVSDDGVRLWIGNSLVINNWTDHGPTLDSATYTFIAGLKTEIFYEFYERAGGAEVRLRWVAGACGTGTAIPRINLFPIATRALDIQQNVVPQWASLRRGFATNGTPGVIANGAAITGFTNGAATPVNAVASNVNGTGMAYTSNSERSESIAFDGIDDSISVAASTIPTTTGARTVAVWVNPTNIGATQDAFGWGTAAANSSFGVSILTNGTLRLYGGGINCDTAAAAITFLTWNHVVVNFTGTVANIYINGALSRNCTGLAWSTPAGSTLYIGAGSTLVNRFSGYLDDIAIWNVVLNSGETNTLYQRQKVFNP